MKAIATQSFKLTKIGIVCFLKHSLDGLPTGTTLSSPIRKLSWKVEKRVLWMHSAHIQKRFPNETENIGHMGFSGLYDPDERAEREIAMEAELGYEYLLKPVGHEEKPSENEELIVELTVEDN
ncbi:MAG: hypothetical protein EOO06_19770 [Chitinophagaceae bacterium]|nr:MAG: hypothetical protein EOO06_19770 [Chitinophagaceae bacterium]